MFMLGALTELIVLYERARAPRAAGAQAKAAVGGLLAEDMLHSQLRLLALGLAVLAAGLLVLFNLLGIAEQEVYIDTPLVSSLFVGLVVFILFAALAAAYFLPLINEQTLLLVQGLLLAGALFGHRPVGWLPLPLLVGLPLAVSLGLIVWQRALPAWLKAGLYFWYLLCVLLTTFQSGQTAYFEADQLTWFDGFAAGAVLVFMLLHGLTAVRFFLIMSSLLRPRNRVLAARAMPRLFSDEQVPLLRFGLVAALTAGLLVANRAYHWVDTAAALSICTLLGVQLMNPPRATEPHAPGLLAQDEA
jgi:hypothetical protein